MVCVEWEWYGPLGVVEPLQWFPGLLGCVAFLVGRWVFPCLPCVVEYVRLVPAQHLCLS